VLCLTCLRLWPRGSRYCGGCGRSFGGRLCPKGHLSPRSALRCTACGDARLSQCTGYVPLGWLYRGVSLACLLLLLRWLSFHRPLVGRGALAVGRWTLEDVLDLPPTAVAAFAAHCLALLAIAVGALALLPHPVGPPVRRLAYRTARALAKWLGRALPRAFGLLARAVGRAVGP
jgi:hypothetical protein